MTTALSSIAFAPLVPWPLIAALAALALAALGLALFRRARGSWWRALGLGAMLGALLNPALVEETRRPLADVAVVVVDDSPSQRVGDRSARTETALASLRARLAALPNLEVREVRVSEVSKTEGAAPASGTRLFAALRDALADVPRRRLAGVIALTDGQVHDAPKNAETLGLDAPFHVLLTGRRDAADRRLIVESAPRYGIVGDKLSLRLRVEDSVPGPRLARVTIRRGGGAARVARVPVGESHTITFTLDRPGPTAIALEVEDGPNELSRINNRAVVEINGVRDRLRVLLISGEAHAGERVWRNLLKADPSVDLVHFTILRPPEKQDATPIRELALISFPIRELFQERLEDFDLIIFDRYRRRGVVPLSYLGNIARYVEKGGALLTAAGPSFATPLSLFRTPLNAVLPAQPTGGVFERGFRAELTEIGRRHPVTADLPGSGGENGDAARWGRWFRQIDVEADRGQVLMKGVGGRPILVLDRVGQGRVAQLLTDQMWLWARGFEGGGPQAELLRRLAHWLMKEPDLEEEELRASAKGNRITILRRSVGDGQGTVAVVSPSGRRREVALEPAGEGRWSATLAVDEPGMYRIREGALSAIAAVGDVNPREYADLRATDRLLAPIAEATGGAVVWLDDGAPPLLRKTRPGRDTAGRGWIGLRANRDYVVTGIRQAPLLPVWLVLALALGGLMLAWRAEGR